MKRHYLNQSPVRTLKAVVAAAVLIASLSLAPAQILVTKTENFNSAASARINGWWEWLSRINGYNYGFSSTDNCGVGAGEAGGPHVRSQNRNGYADVFGDGALLTLADAFQASGKMWVGTNGIASIPGSETGRPGIICGYSDWSQMGRVTSETRNTIGIQVSTVGGTIRSYLMLDADSGSGNRVADTSIMTPAYENVFDWSFSYDPSGGINSTGRMITTVTGPTNGTLTIVTLSVTNDLTAAHRTLGAKFNAFGVWNRCLGAETSYREVYFDSLTYNAISNAPNLPCILVYPTNTVSVSSPNDTNQFFTLGIPPALYTVNPATITVTSLAPGIAVPAGGNTNTGVLSLTLAPGDENVIPVNVTPIGTGGGITTFQIGNTNGVCQQVNEFSVSVFGTQPDPALVLTKCESFDTEASAIANGWTEVSSRIDGNNFGFANSGNAGTAGEAGGAFVRTNSLTAYYADVTMGKLSLNDYISATGTLFINSANITNGDAWIGFFNSANTFSTFTSQPKNLMAIELSDNGAANFTTRFRGHFGDSTSSGFFESGAPANPNLSPLTQYDWKITYNPSVGFGQMVWEVAFSGSPSFAFITNNLTGANRLNTATFDRFGLLRGKRNGEGNPLQLFVDNVCYTAGGPVTVKQIADLGSNLKLTFASAGTNHVVQSASNLTAAVWVNVPSVTLAGPTNLIWTAQFPKPGDSAKFYRVVANPAP